MTVRSRLALVSLVGLVATALLADLLAKHLG